MGGGGGMIIHILGEWGGIRHVHGGAINLVLGKGGGGGVNGINHALGGSYNPCSYKICPGGGGGGGA